MIVARALWLFASNIIWRVMGVRAAGRVLVRALGSKNETLRTIAGMLLVRGGKKSEPLLQEALDKRENLPIALTIIGSIGDREFEPEVRRFSQDPDPDVAKAATDALRIIEAHHSLA
jgi:HEAT repeat protein